MNAARQAVYRNRHLKDIGGQGERIIMVVSVQAKAKLKRLGIHYGVTQREMLARVLFDAESMVVRGLGRGAEKAYRCATAL
jgi:hypothetical protein